MPRGRPLWQPSATLMAACTVRQSRRTEWWARRVLAMEPSSDRMRAWWERVASAPVPGTNEYGPHGFTGKVASVGIPAATVVRAPVAARRCWPARSRRFPSPSRRYTDEARHLRIQGNVVLPRDLFRQRADTGAGCAAGARSRVGRAGPHRRATGTRTPSGNAQRPAVDMTTNITITFQLA